jgi:hypothetical protein
VNQTEALPPARGYCWRMVRRDGGSAFHEEPDQRSPANRLDKPHHLLLMWWSISETYCMAVLLSKNMPCQYRGSKTRVRDGTKMSKTDDEIRREDALRVHDRSRRVSEATNEAVIKAGEVAIRTVMLINGGAAVAVLAFIGALVRDEGVTIKQISGVSGSLLWFAGGVAMAVWAMALSYFTNLCYVRSQSLNIFTFDHPIHPRRREHSALALLGLRVPPRSDCVVRALPGRLLCWHVQCARLDY